MNINFVDTHTTYQRLLNETDAQQREAIFCDEIIAPMQGVVETFGGEGLSTFRQWGMWPDMLQDQPMFAQAFADFADADAWARTAAAFDKVRTAFASHTAQIPLETITAGLYFADLSAIPLQRGQGGFGGLPGWVMTLFDRANDYTLPRIEATAAHEMHHNIRFSVEPFNPMQATVGQYIVAEGLAESFAAALYGEDTVGFYVTDFDSSRLEETRNLIGAELEKTGFSVLQSYIFGDVIMKHMNQPTAGVPDFAGYYIGYQVVQAYLQRTGKSLVETTFVPSSQIIAESGYFVS